MAHFNSISSGIWEDDKFRKLQQISSKLLYVYSFTNLRCPISGIYKVSIETMSFETGILPDCQKELEEIISAGLVSYDFQKSVIWVHGKIKHDKSWTTGQRIKSISRSLGEFHNCSFISGATEKYPFLVDLAIKAEDGRKRMAGTREKEVEVEEEEETEIETDGSTEGI